MAITIHGAGETMIRLVLAERRREHAQEMATRVLTSIGPENLREGTRPLDQTLRHRLREWANWFEADL